MRVATSQRSPELRIWLSQETETSPGSLSRIKPLSKPTSLSCHWSLITERWTVTNTFFSSSKSSPAQCCLSNTMSFPLGCASLRIFLTEGRRGAVWMIHLSEWAVGNTVLDLNDMIGLCTTITVTVVLIRPKDYSSDVLSSSSSGNPSCFKCFCH